jgi:PAS domain S-box-containing protein
VLTRISLTTQTLADALEQSIDCVKLVGVNGEILWMNRNGMCAMEIDDFCQVEGQSWGSLWPDDANKDIIAAYFQGRTGKTSRFKAFCPTAKGSPRWWEVSVSPVTDDSAELVGYLATSRDVTTAEMNRRALAVMMSEMRHRLRNTYAVSCSLMIALARGDPEKEAFARDMCSRLTSLATSQTLVIDEDKGCDLAELIGKLLEPFNRSDCPVTWPATLGITVDKELADALALVISELAVNAAKHGAFFYGGTVAVNARLDNNLLTVIWSERSEGKVVSHARTGGQGLNLIAMVLEPRGADFNVDWHESGLCATVSSRVGAVATAGEVALA